MAPTKKRPEEKREEALRALQRQPANRRCADCTEKLPQSIIMDFGTFVCTVCSGIHREFSHRVKSISLSNFTDDEVEIVKKEGNDTCNTIYMARHDARHDIPEPDGASAEKRREFIRMKYVDKRWYATPEDMTRYRQNQERAAAARTSGGGNTVVAEPLRRRRSARTTVNGTDAASMGRPLPAAPGAAAAAAGGARAAPANDLLDLLSSPAPPPPAPVVAPAAVAAAAPVSPWNAFGGSPQAGFGAAPAPAPWDAFGGGGGGGGTPQPQQQPQPQYSASPQGGFGLAPPPPPPRTHDQHLQQQQQPPPQQQQQPQQGFAQFPQQPFGGPQQPQQPQHAMPMPGAVPAGAVPFAAFGGPAPPPHQQQYYAPQQQGGYPQQPHQQPPQQAFAQPMPPANGGAPMPPPRQAQEDITDPFAALSVRDTRAPSAPRYYEAGEDCWYISNGERVQVLVMKVHHDAGDPPYYTIRLASGFEKQTDYLHLNKHAQADGAAQGQGQAAAASQAPQQQKAVVADPFSALENSAWAKVGSPSRGGGNIAVPLPAVPQPTAATPVPAPRDAAANPFGQGQGWSPPSNGFHPPAAQAAPATAGNPFDNFF